jgi:urea transport system substrate-binding protein
MNPNHHISKTVRIGEVREDGLFEIVYSTDGPVDPVPWNQYVPETKGYACDWSDPKKGGKYKAEDAGAKEGATEESKEAEPAETPQ